MTTSIVIALAVVVGLAVLAMLGMAIYFLVKLLRLVSLVRSDLMPTQGKVAFWFALIYGLMPLDLLPDPIYLDDIGIAAAVIAYVTRLAHRHGIIGRDRTARGIGSSPLDGPRALDR